MRNYRAPEKGKRKLNVWLWMFLGVSRGLEDGETGSGGEGRSRGRQTNESRSEVYMRRSHRKASLT